MNTRYGLSVNSLGHRLVFLFSEGTPGEDKS